MTTVIDRPLRWARLRSRLKASSKNLRFGKPRHWIDRSDAPPFESLNDDACHVAGHPGDLPETFRAGAYRSRKGFRCEPLGCNQRKPLRDRYAPARNVSEVREALRDMAGVVVQAFKWREAHRFGYRSSRAELPNRRLFEDALSRERKRAQRNGRSITVVMIVLDRIWRWSRRNSEPESANRIFCNGSRSCCEGRYAIQISWFGCGAREFAVLNQTRTVRGPALSPSICATNSNYMNNRERQLLGDGEPQHRSV